MWGVLCSVVWREVLLPFSVLTVSLWLFVSLFVSRFRWDCTAGCSEHSREAPNTFGFGIAAGCSEHSREAPNAFGFGRRRLFRAQPGSSQRFRVRSPPAVQSTAGKLPTLSGSVAAGCSEHSRKLPTLTALVAVGCLKHSQEAPLGSMRPCRPCIPLVLLPPRRLCLIWHMAPAVCWINVVEALHALIQPSKHKRHTVARI